MSNHYIKIEKGRHQRQYAKLEDTMCQICNKEKDDEIHFLLRCQTHQEIRDTLPREIKPKDLLITTLYLKTTGS